jgi:hypothetical protein
MAGLRSGHPRLSYSSAAKTWMPGTRPGMTTFDTTPYSIGCILSQTLTKSPGWQAAMVAMARAFSVSIESKRGSGFLI